MSARLADDPDDRFVCAWIEVTGGNPLLVRELLDEGQLAAWNRRRPPPRLLARSRRAESTTRVLLRLARLAPAAGALARAASVLGDRAQISDVARLAGVEAEALEGALPALVTAGVIDPGVTVRFAHPILRSAVYEDLSAAERERLHHAASVILRERRAPAIQVATQVMHTEPTADPKAVAQLREAARGALASATQPALPRSYRALSKSLWPSLATRRSCSSSVSESGRGRPTARVPTR